MIASLDDLLEQGLLKTHETSDKEIRSLFRIVERDIKDAAIPYLSLDRRFPTAYNAALQLATIVLRAHGFRSNPNKAAHHRISIDTIPLIMGHEFRQIKSYFDSCRIKRNICEYTSSEEVSEKEVQELLITVNDFGKQVRKWLLECHPDIYFDQKK